MTDLFLQLALSAPVPNDVRQAAMNVIAKAQAAMPWVGGLAGQAGLIFNAGNWPRPTVPEEVASDPQQQAQWREFIAAYAPLTKQVLKGAMAQAKAEGERLAADVALWDRVYRITQAVATTGISEVTRLWAQLQEKLTKLKADRAATRVLLDTVRKKVDDPRLAPVLTAQKAQLAQLDATQQQIAAGTASALGPISSLPGVREDLGLGAAIPGLQFLTPAKLIAAGIGAAVLITVLTAISIWVDRQAEVRMQANQLANDTLARENGAAEQLLRDGKITVAQYQTIKAQNAKDVAVVRDANEGGPGFGASMGKSFGIILGLGVLGLVGYGIWKKTRKSVA